MSARIPLAAQAIAERDRAVAERDAAVAREAALRESVEAALRMHPRGVDDSTGKAMCLRCVANWPCSPTVAALTGEGPAGAGTEPDTEPIPDHATCPACSLRVRVLYLDQRPVYEFHRRLTVNSGVCSASGKPFPAPRGAAEVPQPDPPREVCAWQDESLCPIHGTSPTTENGDPR